MDHRDIVVIGTSAGGLQALTALLPAIPEDLGAAILIVMHRTENTASVLPDILSRNSSLPVHTPEDGATIRRNHIYLAPAGVHMLLENGRIRLVRGPRENRHRPAVDPLFRSAAATYGPRVIGIILTGMLDDGTSGLMVVCAHGGEAIVQNPATAMFPAMPQNALNRVPDAQVLDLEEIPSTLAEMVKAEVDAKDYRGFPNNEDLAVRESKIADAEMSEIENDNHVGEPSEFACPECGGVLWEIEQGDLLRFRCRVGHAYTADHLQAAQRHAVESALWAGLRALEESLSMYRKLAVRAKATNNRFTAQLYADRIATTETNTRVLQQFLLDVNDHGEEIIPNVDESA